VITPNTATAATIDPAAALTSRARSVLGKKNNRICTTNLLIVVFS
jgi:hypothetical protein